MWNTYVNYRDTKSSRTIARMHILEMYYYLAFYSLNVKRDKLNLKSVRTKLLDQTVLKKTATYISTSYSNTSFQSVKIPRDGHDV